MKERKPSTGRDSKLEHPNTVLLKLQSKKKGQQGTPGEAQVHTSTGLRECPASGKKDKALELTLSTI